MSKTSNTDAATRRQKYADALVDSVGEFIKVSIFGLVLIGICYGAQLYTALEIDVTPFVLFCTYTIPFGWTFFTWLQAKLGIGLYGGVQFWAFFLFVKLTLAALVGIPCFVFQVVKTVAKLLYSHHKVAIEE